MEPQQVLFAFALTLFAGLSTGIGSAIAYLLGMIVMALSLLFFI